MADRQSVSRSPLRACADLARASPAAPGPPCACPGQRTWPISSPGESKLAGRPLETRRRTDWTAPRRRPAYPAPRESPPHLGRSSPRSPRRRRVQPRDRARPVTASTPSLRPDVAPAACRWVRTIVESTDTAQARSSSASGPGPSARCTPAPGCHVGPHPQPAVDALAVAVLPRQADPPRSGLDLEATASTTSRWSRHRPPCCAGRSGSSGSTPAHSTSVNGTPRPTTARPAQDTPGPPTGERRAPSCGRR